MNLSNQTELPEIVPGVVQSISGPPLRRAMVFVNLSWMFGSVWLICTAGAPITLFAKSLHATEFQFGILSALPFLASLLNLPASLMIERTGKRKKIFLWGLYAQRLMWIPLAILPVWMVHHYGIESAKPAMVVFLILIFAMHAGQAIGGPAWISWMADIIPDRVRGAYFSKRRQLGILTAIPAALLVGWLLDHKVDTHQAMPTMIWCAGVFLVACFFGTMDIHLFRWVPEIHKAPRAGAHLYRSLLEPLRNRQFLWFAAFVGTLVFAVSFMGQFVTLFLIEKIKVTNSGTQMMLLVAPMVAQLLVLPVWGKLVDRMGKKPALAIASLGLAPVGLGWCLMNGGHVWLGYLLSSLGAALWVGVEIANFNLVMEFSSTQDDNGNGTSSYIAVNGVIINIAGCLGGLSSGLIARWLRDWHVEIAFLGIGSITFYEVLFAISGMLRFIAAVAFLPMIHEPAAKPTHEALRYMTANIYNNLYNAILQPIRFVNDKIEDMKGMEE